MKLISIIDKKENIVTFDKKYCISVDKTEINISINNEEWYDSDDIFYGEKIKSISCISGKNGKGKSTILNDIFNTSFSGIKIFVADVDNQSIFYILNKLKSKDKIVKIRDNNQKLLDNKVEKIGYDKLTSEILFFSSIIEPVLQTPYSENDLSMGTLLRNIPYEELMRVDMKKQMLFLNNSVALESPLWKEELCLQDKSVKLTLSELGESIRLSRAFIVKDASSFEKINFDKFVDDLFEKSKQKIEFKNKVKSKYTNDNLIKVLVLHFVSILTSQLDKSDYEELESNFNSYNELDFYEIISEINKKIDESPSNDSGEEIRGLVDAFRRVCETILNSEDRIYNVITDKEVLKELTAFFNSDNFLVLELFESLTLTWESISSGEYNLLNLFGRLYSRLNSSDNKKVESDIILLLDEIDAGLHPSWQLKWMNLFLEGLQLLDRKFQVIFTTHSPLLLTDISEKNILFLSGYKQVKEDIQIGTFGQNIQKLLTNGFFVDDTIGDFSKNKISKLANTVRRLEYVISEAYEQKELMSDTDFLNDILKTKEKTLARCYPDVDSKMREQYFVEKVKENFREEIDEYGKNEIGYQECYNFIRNQINQIGEDIYRRSLSSDLDIINKNNDNLIKKIERFSDEEVKEFIRRNDEFIKLLEEREVK